MKNEVKLTLSIMFVVLIRSSVSNNCNWPNECQLVGDYSGSNHIQCEMDSSTNLDFNFNLTQDQIDNCEISKNKPNKTTYLEFRRKPLRDFVLRRDFINPSSLEKILNRYSGKKFILRFNYLSGFQVDFTKNLERPSSKNIYSIDLKKSNIDFYYNEKLLETCKDYIKHNLTSPQSIFQLNSDFNVSQVFVLHCEFKRKVCPLIFSKSNIKYFLISSLFNTFFKQNLLNFNNLSSLTMLNKISFKLNSKINELCLIDPIYKIDIDKKLLNKDVFKELRLIELNQFSQINLIEKDVFKPFQALKKILFIDIDVLSTRDFFQRNGIEWTKFLNTNLINMKNLNATNTESIINFAIQNYPNADEKNKFDMIRFEIELQAVFDIETIKTQFPDEDFCLYKDFPFSQLVYIYNRFEINANEMKPTCTYLWLIKFYPIYHKHSQLHSYHHKWWSHLGGEALIRQCKFEKKLEICNRSTIMPSLTNSCNNMFNVLIVFEFFVTILIFTTPLICLFGIFTNILIIITISDIKKQKELKDFLHYDYMRINSIVHCIILVISVLGLINECTDEFWCSDINRLVFIQYYKIVFSQFLGNSLRFLANFTYLAFLLSRLSLIGKDHGKLVIYMSNKKSIKVYISITVLLSLIFGVVKFFEFLPVYINHSPTSNRVHAYPEKLIFFAVENIRDMFNVRLFLIFNVLCDFINYVVFLVLNLMLDIKMFLEFKKSLAEKAKKVEQTEKQKRKSDLAINHTISMVILNALTFFLLKTPILIYDFILFYTNELGKTKNNHESTLYRYCNDQTGCEFLEKISNISYFLSISISLLFYYQFDKNFQASFRFSILKEKKVIIVKKKNLKN